jgi:hypothetical protein
MRATHQSLSETLNSNLPMPDQGMKARMGRPYTMGNMLEGDHRSPQQILRLYTP